MTDWSKVSPHELIAAMQSGALVNRVRQVFVNEMGQMIQADAQRDPPNPIDRRRAEFGAAEKLIAEVNR